MQIDFFSSIPVRFSGQEVYRRLGFCSHTTRLVPAEKKRTDAAVAEARKYIELRGCARVFSVKKITRASVVLGNNVFKSKLLVTVLKDSTQALLFGATAGARIMEKIEELRADDLTRAVIYDAVASVAVDNALAWIQEYYRRNLVRENKTVIARRVSCGYSDFPLAYQKSFYKLLRMSRLGVRLTKTCMLIPEKSVTAVTGIIEAGS